MIDQELPKDPTLIELKQLVEGGTPEEAGDWLQTTREYHMKHASYTVVDNTVLVDGKAIIPAGMRSQMLTALHRSHAGINGMKDRARDAMFWPGMNKDIERTCIECKTCHKTTPSQTATPPKPLPVPDYPFQMMSSDYFELEGHHYLVLACRYSSWFTTY